MGGLMTDPQNFWCVPALENSNLKISKKLMSNISENDNPNEHRNKVQTTWLPFLKLTHQQATPANNVQKDGLGGSDNLGFSIPVRPQSESDTHGHHCRRHG